MTRINTIPVEYLTDQHLMAEYRELPMVSASLRRSLNSKHGVKGIPEFYTLNTGHVKFFYDKGKFLKRRYEELIEELTDRGYNINPKNRDVDFNVFVDNDMFDDWKPNKADMIISAHRIIERVEARNGWYRYNGEVVDSNDYAKELMNVFEEKGDNEVYINKDI